MKFNVIDFNGLSFYVKMFRSFRVLHKRPKHWAKVAECITEHGQFESGITDVYQSKTTRKYYMVRYFENSSSHMYVEVFGFDWSKFKGNTEKEKGIRLKFVA